MYRVTVVTDGKEYPLLNKYLKLQSPSLKEVAGNSPGSGGMGGELRNWNRRMGTCQENR